MDDNVYDKLIPWEYTIDLLSSFWYIDRNLLRTKIGIELESTSVIVWNLSYSQKKLYYAFKYNQKELINKLETISTVNSHEVCPKKTEQKKARVTKPKLKAKNSFRFAFLLSCTNGYQFGHTIRNLSCQDDGHT